MSGGKTAVEASREFRAAVVALMAALPGMHAALRGANWLALWLARCVKDIADGMRDGLDKLWYG